jgi:hypothetical protein
MAWCRGTDTFFIIIYRKNFYFDRFHGCALQSDQYTAGCKAHTNFADELVYLTADNARNELVKIHRSQEVLKMLSLYTYISFAFHCFVKKHKYNNPTCTYSIPDTNFHLTEQEFVG